MTVPTEASKLMVDWLNRCVVSSARGDGIEVSTVSPKDRFWLGLLYTLDSVLEAAASMGDRADRVAPCEMGIRLRLEDEQGPWEPTVTVEWRAWRKSTGDSAGEWTKTRQMRAGERVSVAEVGRDYLVADAAVAAEMAAESLDLSMAVSVRVDRSREGLVMSIRALNDSPQKGREGIARELYEVRLSVEGVATRPFVLEALPDSFRYDRDRLAYGDNCGVLRAGQRFVSADTVEVDRGRPTYWLDECAQPDLSFNVLADDPLPHLDELVAAYRRWVDQTWSTTALTSRALDMGWSAEMLAEAEAARGSVETEMQRLQEGLSILRSNAVMLRSFRLMNKAIAHAAADKSGSSKYDSWRPFQVGFLLTMLRSVASEDPDDGVVDTVWFATGGGKTETYLGLLVTAALYERLSGRSSGITAWSRFPLRMLSLQQTQRFANALAGAEIQRREEGIPGDPFSLGFFVGSRGTPNRIPLEPKNDGDFDVEDDAAPARFQVLLECPFCKHDSIEMGFDRRLWRLEHRCSRAGFGCPWPDEALPFMIVDDEIYRFLPTVVVGTLDKAANIGMQTGMLAFVGPPFAICDRPGHGYAYAKRGKTPSGCLVPECKSTVSPLRQDARWFGTTFRLQDELHLLRDSLGAVDSHYESLLDEVQARLTGRRPKIVASSATLAGHDRQAETLFRRSGRVFPQQGVQATRSFWSSDSGSSNLGSSLLRRYIALMARGATLDFVNDRTTEAIQQCVRRLHADPEGTCAQIGVAPKYAAELVSLYGTTVIYGTTVRDVEAAHRSAETQLDVEPPANVVQLTGGTPLEEVRQILSRLDEPEEAFQDRIHILPASSMMSHGVDIDRLNVMTMLGLPLTTAEFIQASARVGRRHPGLVHVIHRPARERDAATFRDFDAFVAQGDRFVEPIAVTRRSRRVADLTLPGVLEAHRLMIHERHARTSLSTIKPYREYLMEDEERIPQERASARDTIALQGDHVFRDHVDQWLDMWAHNVRFPPPDSKFPGDALPGKARPMRSLRDVEQQAPVREVEVDD